MTRGLTATRLALVTACLAGLALPSTSSASLSRGDLIVADARAFGGGALFEVDPVTGAESVLSSNTMPVNASSQLFDLPFTIATNAAGEIFVANTANLGGSCKNGCGGVIRVDPATGAESVLSSNAMAVNAASQYFGELTGIAVDPHGEILVTSWGGKLGDASIIRVNPTTGKETLLSDNQMPINASDGLFAYPQGVIANASGEIFVVDPLAFGEHGGGVIGVNPSTGRESEVSANTMPINAGSQFFHAPSQVALNAQGDLLVDDWCAPRRSCGGIIEVDPRTGKETEISSNELPINADSAYFSESTAAAVEEDGEIIEVQQAGLGGLCENGCGGLVTVNPANGKETELSANSLAVNSASEDYVEPFDVLVYGSATPPGPAGAHNGQEQPAPPAVDAPVPATPAASSSPPPGPLISGLAESHRSWSEHAGRRRRRSGRRAPTGTQFSFSLNEPAQVDLEFTHAVRGRRARGACASATHRRNPACTVTRPVGTLHLVGRAGLNTVSFDGRLSGTVTLPPGSYEVSASPTGPTGKSSPQKLTFRIDS